jgi:Fe-S-cluster containining protein
MIKRPLHGKNNMPLHMNADSFTAAYDELNDSVYRAVPDAGCCGCGQCCVTPHVTLIEFCYSIQYLQKRPELFSEAIARIVSSHPDYQDQRTCRFQLSDHRCGIHPCRPLACRLHGHPVLAAMNNQYDVHCDKTMPAADLTPDDVYALLDRVNAINARFYQHYQPPYWICGLNVETWLSICVVDMHQPLFLLVKEVISRAVPLGTIAGLFRQVAPIKEKIALVDMLHAADTIAQPEARMILLEKIKDGFPETGAYYYFEAEHYLRGMTSPAVTG